MDEKNSELLERLLAMFRIEADEYVKAMSSGLLELEKQPAGGSRQQEIIESIFRQAHSLKGAARAVKFTQIEAICQPFESIFAALRDGQMSMSTPLADLLHQAVSLVEALAGSTPDAARERQPEVAMLVRQLDRTLGRRPGRAAPAKPQPAADPAPAVTPEKTVQGRTAGVPAMGTVRISSSKLDAIMRLSEEMLGPRLAAAQRAKEIGDTLKELSAWRKRSAHIQMIVRSVDRSLSSSYNMPDDFRAILDHLADESVRARALEDRFVKISRAADHDRRTLASMTAELQERVREMQLLPCATLLDMFARQARGLAREQGKIVDLQVHGSDIEVDRRLLDEIKDPLVHLVRNCVDHGIEIAPQRQKAGKPVEGIISISVAQMDSGKITLTVSDDGAGVDILRLKSVAVERGLIHKEEADTLTDTTALDLLFRSGLSTSKLITDVSGRGLGMAIVRDKVEQLGGSIEVATEVGAGTRFRIVLPVNLATFQGTLVEACGQAFIVPSANVDRVARIAYAAIHEVNNSETVDIDGQALALVRLSDILGMPRPSTISDDHTLSIVLGQGKSRVAFRVDAVIGEQETLVKTLGPQLRRVRYVLGASVLGNGQVVPVLNVPDLLDAAGRQSATVPATAAPVAPAQQSILVAEDSITSRSLMKNILEAAGFRVATAVDGVDAFTMLKTQAFDLLVSDVDMPRLNGFDLATKVRADKQLNELPVILVTTLDSREHRERGVDAGANAYIVKSSFDQGNLLEVIRRLI